MSIGIQKNSDSVVALKEPTNSLAENANCFLPHTVSLNSYNLEVSMVTNLVPPGKKLRLRDSTPNHTANKQQATKPDGHQLEQGVQILGMLFSFSYQK